MFRNTKRKRQGGFSFMELMIVLLVVSVLVAVVVLAMSGFFTKTRGTAMSGDIHTVKNAVDAYLLQSYHAPTETGALPPAGEYALIDFDATFTEGVITYKFFPSFLAKLPRHWDEGVWRIDNSALVSVDMSPDNY